jgi:hypothetical protein
MTIAMNRRGWPIRAYVAAALAGICLQTLTACSAPPSDSSVLTRLCASTTDVIHDIEAPDRSGPLDIVDLQGDLSIYETAWRLRAAHESGISNISGTRKAVRTALIKAATGSPDAKFSDSIDGLELTATAAAGVAQLGPTAAEAEQLARAIGQYETGTGYALERGDSSSPYATLIATDALDALNVPIPQEVVAHLDVASAHLPKVSVASLDETIAPVVAAYAHSVSKKSLQVKKLPLAEWIRVVDTAEQSGQTLAISALLHEVAMKAGVHVPVPLHQFKKLKASGGWAVQRGGEPDPRATFYAIKAGLQSKGLKRYLSSGKANIGWFGLVKQPSISTIYTEMRTSEICSSKPSLQANVAAKLLKIASSSGSLPLLDVGRICYLEDRFGVTVFDRKQLSADLRGVEQSGLTFDAAVEFKATSAACGIQPDGRVHLVQSDSVSSYGYGNALLEPSPGWPGIVGEVNPVLRPVPEGYAILLDQALLLRDENKAIRNKEADRFSCGNLICPISHNMEGDSSSQSPKLIDQVVMLELVAGSKVDRANSIVLAAGR